MGTYSTYSVLTLKSSFRLALSLESLLESVWVVWGLGSRASSLVTTKGVVAARSAGRAALSAGEGEVG